MHISVLPNPPKDPNHSLLSIPGKESGPKMHEKVQTRNCTRFHKSWRKISQRSKIEKKMYFDAWKLTYCTTIQTCGLFSILHQPKSWHKSSITKSNKRRDDDDAEETLVPVCWMVMKNQTKNGIFSVIYDDFWWFHCGYHFFNGIF